MSDNSKTLPDRSVPSRNAVIKGLRCGSCYHFAHYRAADFPETCNQIGITKDAAPCVSYSPSPTGSRMSRKHDAASQLARVMRNIPTSDIPALAAMIAGEHITRKHGFYFGQIVFVRVFAGGTHLNHFAKAFVVRADAQYVYLQGTGKKPWAGKCFHNSVITAKKFRKMRADMERTNNVIDRKAAVFFGGSGYAVQDISRIGAAHPKSGIQTGGNHKPQLVKTTLIVAGRKVERRTATSSAPIKAFARLRN